MRSDTEARTGDATDLSRRRFMVAAGVAAAMCVAPRSLVAADGIVEDIRRAAATNNITAKALRGGVSVVTGSGGNIAVLPGPDGKLLVDAGISESRARITAALLGISGDPVGHLVNTHWHFDHTDGNAWLHQSGAAIIAHETTRKRLSVRHRVAGWRFTFPAAPQAALPTILFKQELTLDLNGESVELNYYEPAHTDCDVSAHFTRADVLHVGDTWWNGVYPFIDYSSGGSLDGMIDASESNLSRAGDQTVIIPGHGPVGDRGQLREFRDMLVTVRDRVSALKQSGRSQEHVIAAKPTADLDPKWGQWVTTPDAFTALVYQGV